MKVSSKILVTTLLLLLLNGCMSALPPTVKENLTGALAAIVEAPISTPAATADLPATAFVEPTAMAVSPAEVKIITPSSEPVTSNCLTCHTDKEMLIAVSAPVEEPEDSLSSGVG